MPGQYILRKIVSSCSHKVCSSHIWWVVSMTRFVLLLWDRLNISTVWVVMRRKCGFDHWPLSIPLSFSCVFYACKWKKRDGKLVVEVRNVLNLQTRVWLIQRVSTAQTVSHRCWLQALDNGMRWCGGFIPSVSMLMSGRAAAVMLTGCWGSLLFLTAG